MYGDDPHIFPDVTEQLLLLNKGRRTQFTPAYEDYLWKRFDDDDFEDDDDDEDDDLDDDDDDFDDEFDDDDDDDDEDRSG